MNPEEKQVTALVTVEESELPEKRESYWTRISARYTVAFRVLLVALLLFLALFMLLFSRAFTYDSLFSFFKDLQSVSSFMPSDYDTVYATYEEGEYTALSYRGGVAFVNSGGVEIYSPDGSRLLDVSREFNTPRAVASRKYLVAYDSGGTTFSVTNSYTELFHGETEFPIYGAAISDSGYFALITASDEVLSQVLLYDNNFNLIQRFKRASATVGVGLSDNGKRIALLGIAAVDGTTRSVLDMYRLGESKPVLSLAFEKEFPLAVGFTNNKSLVVLTDTALRTCALDGDVKNELALNGAIVGFTVGKEGALLALETDEINAMNRIIALNKKGKLLYDGEFTGDIKSLALGDEEIFLLSGNELLRITTDKEERTVVTIEEGATDLFTVDPGEVRVVFPAKAEYIVFED